MPSMKRKYVLCEDAELKMDVLKVMVGQVRCSTRYVTKTVLKFLLLWKVNSAIWSRMMSSTKRVKNGNFATGKVAFQNPIHLSVIQRTEKVTQVEHNLAQNHEKFQLVNIIVWSNLIP